MKILLLNPNITLKRESRGEFSFFPPLGLACLAALLRPKGHTVRIVDLNLKRHGQRVAEVRLPDGNTRYGYPDEELDEIVAAFRPDVVGVSSIFTPFYRDAIRVAQRARVAAPSSLIVMGGAHVSMSWEEAIKEEGVDVVIRGEGELPFAGMIEALAANPERDLKGLRGVVWKDATGTVHDGGMGQQVDNLDELPIPALDLLEMDFYCNLRDLNFAYCKRYPIGHLITSRGCPYACTFCSTRNFFPNYRANSPERVIAEIRFLKENYGVREIHFHDDAFLIQRKRVARICELLISEKLDVTWQISQGVNINLLTPELLSLMKRSGMYRLGLPIESGSERTLESIKKPANLEHARKMIAAANEVGLFTHANFIIGFPDETADDIQKTYDFAVSCGVDFLKILVCQPLAGAPLYEEYRRDGLLEEVKHSSTYTSTDYRTKHFTADDLNRLRKDILRGFQIQRFRRVLSPTGFRKTVWPKLNGRDSLLYFARIAALSSRAFLLQLNAGH